jgi:hypothetical protein
MAAFSGMIKMMLCLNRKSDKTSVMIDIQKLDLVTDLFFSVFNTTENKRPNWALLNSICIPEAQFIRQEAGKHITYSLDLFIRTREEILSSGELMDFEEREVCSETKVNAGIAQRCVLYEKNGMLPGAKSFRLSGTKLMHFLKDDHEWKLSSVVWEDSDYTDPVLLAALMGLQTSRKGICYRTIL